MLGFEWTNKQADTELTLNHLTLVTKRISMDTPFTITGKAELHTRSKHLIPGDLNAKIKFNTRAIISPKNKLYTLGNIHMTAYFDRIGQQTFSKTPLTLNLAANILFDLNKYHVTIKDINTYLSNIQLQGQIDGKAINHNAEFYSSISLLPFNLQETFAKLSIPTHFANPNVMRNVTGQFDVSFSADHVNFKKIDAHVDNTHIQGQGEIKNPKKPTLRFALRMSSFSPLAYIPHTQSEQKIIQNPGKPQQPFPSSMGARSTPTHN